jgi:hypothetical protein
VCRWVLASGRVRSRWIPPVYPATRRPGVVRCWWRCNRSIQCGGVSRPRSLRARRSLAKRHGAIEKLQVHALAGLIAARLARSRALRLFCQNQTKGARTEFQSVRAGQHQEAPVAIKGCQANCGSMARKSGLSKVSRRL